ncbi:MAG: phosphate acetyltransferase [Pseudobacteriovorax sp.]|nr:phosphate acetyltransferase [Pseudobacteriovorax sp.]
MKLSGHFAQSLITQTQKHPRSIVFPEGDDPRVIDAVSSLIDQKCTKQVKLLGDSNKIRELLSSSSGKLLEDHRVQVLETSELIPKAESCYQSYLNSKNRSAEKAAIDSWAKHPANQAASLLFHGEVEAAIGGCVYSTATIIKATIQGVGLEKNPGTISGSFAMVKELDGSAAHKSYVFADCGVVIEPTAEQLVTIAEDSVKTFQQLFPDEEPKVAFLSFSTKGSAQHAAADKMIEAAEAFKKANPKIIADGELQFDAAFVPEVARRKSPDSSLQGDANCFIFPDLNSGNIAYKITQRLAGFDAYGPILQGGAKPYSDLSRGATSKDIFMASLITMLRC